MSQHDFNIANQGFPATRADINNAFQAIASNSSGATAPSTTYANMWWYDTTNNKMYLRNEADSAWIEVATIDQTNNEWQITTGVVQAKDSDGLALKTDDGTTRLFIKDSDGSVGVGTTSPSVKFQVSNNGSGEADIARFNRTNSSDVHFLDIGVDPGNNQVIFDSSGSSAGAHVFRAGGTERLRVTSGGHVLNGGITDITDATENSSGNAFSGSSSYANWTSWGSGSHTHAAFRNGTTQAGTIATSSSGVTYNTTSDRRLKTDIQPIQNGTEKLMAMNPVSHKWKADPDAAGVFGFIAQEMQDIAPEAVTGDPDSDEMMSMDYGRITPLIVAALQEANAKIEALETRLAELEAE